jgi:hypothetical protein
MVKEKLFVYLLSVLPYGDCLPHYFNLTYGVQVLGL